MTSKPVDAYTIEVMEEKHLDDVVAIENMSHTNPWKLEAFKHELSQNPFSRPRVALTKGAIQNVAGYCVLWVVFEHAHIQNIAVHPHHRRRHLARLLLRAAVAEARDAGAETVALETRRSNDAAQKLYLTEGFSLVGERRGYYSRPSEDAVQFERILSPAVDERVANPDDPAGRAGRAGTPRPRS